MFIMVFSQVVWLLSEKVIEQLFKVIISMNYVFYCSYVFYLMLLILSDLDLKECPPPFNFSEINW